MENGQVAFQGTPERDNEEKETAGMKGTQVEIQESALQETIEQELSRAEGTGPKEISGNEDNVSIKERLKKMKTLFRKRNITEEDRYQNILTEIESCTPTELDNIEVLLIGEKECGQQLERFSGIISIYVGLLSMICSAYKTLSSMVADGLTPTMSYEAVMVAFGELLLLCIVAIALYMFIRHGSHRIVNPAVYLLATIKRYRERKTYQQR